MAPSCDLREVSVIVAAKNELANIKACIDSILVAAPGASIIVVDDASTDGTQEVLREFGDKILLLKGPGRGPGKARNIGLKQSKGPWVAFIDADAVVEPECISQLFVTLTSTPEKVASVGGLQLCLPDASVFEKNVASFFSQLGFVSDYVHEAHEPIRVRHNPTCNVMYRREAINQVGGFDEGLFPCEDLELDIRLKNVGYTFLFIPTAKVFHQKPESTQALLGMMRRYGFGHGKLVLRHGPCQLLHAVPAIVVVCVLILAVLAMSCLPLAWLFLLLPMLLVLGYFFSKQKSFALARQKTFWLFGSVLWWTEGFFQGLIQSEKIYLHDEHAICNNSGL